MGDKIETIYSPLTSPGIIGALSTLGIMLSQSGTETISGYKTIKKHL